MLTLRKKFIVDEKGRKIATVLPYTEWRKITTILEEYGNICAYDKAKSRTSNPVSFKKAVKKLKTSRK